MSLRVLHFGEHAPLFFWSKIFGSSARCAHTCTLHILMLHTEAIQGCAGEPHSVPSPHTMFSVMILRDLLLIMGRKWKQTFLTVLNFNTLMCKRWSYCDHLLWAVQGPKCTPHPKREASNVKMTLDGFSHQMIDCRIWLGTDNCLLTLILLGTLTVLSHCRDIEDATWHFMSQKCNVFQQFQSRPFWKLSAELLSLYKVL